MKKILYTLIFLTFISGMIFSEQLIGYGQDDYGISMYVPESYKLVNNDMALIAVNDSLGVSLGYYYSNSDKSVEQHLRGLEFGLGAVNQLDSAEIVIPEEELEIYGADSGITGFYRETGWENNESQSVIILKKDSVVVMISLRISGNVNLETLEMLTDCISLFRFNEIAEGK